jgi:hypothetical protein
VTITCGVCKKKFKSLLVVPEKAMRELEPELQKHMQYNHIKEATVIQGKVQRLLFLAAWYLAATELFEVPEDESYLNGIIQKHQDEMMSLIGFDPTPESEDVPIDSEPEREGADVGKEEDDGNSGGHSKTTSKIHQV